MYVCMSEVEWMKFNIEVYINSAYDTCITQNTRVPSTTSPTPTVLSSLSCLFLLHHHILITLNLWHKMFMKYVISLNWYSLFTSVVIDVVWKAGWLSGWVAARLLINFNRTFCCCSSTDFASGLIQATRQCPHNDGWNHFRSQQSNPLKTLCRIKLKNRTE